MPNLRTATLAAGARLKFEPMPKVLTGTLFNTQEQRDQLDRARLRGGAPEAEVVAPVEGERSVINGCVKRSDGRNTVWVDDVMKRDPRAEVVEQLEPNVVGGMTKGLTRVATASPKTGLSAASGTSQKRSHVIKKTRHRAKLNLPKTFKRR